jgi:mRNA interferase YafQ
MRRADAPAEDDRTVRARSSESQAAGQGPAKALVRGRASAEDAPLERRHRAHALSGEWASFRECHLEADWLLVWRETGEELILVRTGTHSDLFG